jgi:hypothetical protein
LNTPPNSPVAVHFHIVWSGAAGVHFARFGSREEADELARRLARLDETYSIEAFDDSCQTCAELLGNSGKR